MKYDVLIIGAGAAGLIARHDLLKAGLRVCMVEAAATAGGRMATLKEEGFEQPVETGAEFIHGELPLSLSLLDQAGIHYVPVEGKMITVEKGKWQKNEAHDKHWDAFMRQLKKLDTDMSIADFLQKYFSGDAYNSLRTAVQKYAEGFDLADINHASAMAALREWGNEGETQYRIPGGYIQLVDYLSKQSTTGNGIIHFNTCITHIVYSQDTVTVHTKNNQSFQASALLITASAGILQESSIEFVPALPASYLQAIQQLGFGTVIKFLLQFTTPFWKEKATDIGFIISNETIPTWWTQLSTEDNLLTGWLGGPVAAMRSDEPSEALLESALISLSAIFDIPVNTLQKQLSHQKIFSWKQHRFVKGGYSYNTVGSVEAKKILSHPVEGTVFFGGEALYNGQSQGTVEAALQNGRTVAKKIIDKLVTVH